MARTCGDPWCTRTHDRFPEKRHEFHVAPKTAPPAFLGRLRRNWRPNDRRDIRQKIVEPVHAQWYLLPLERAMQDSACRRPSLELLGLVHEQSESRHGRQRELPR